MPDVRLELTDVMANVSDSSSASMKWPQNTEHRATVSSGEPLSYLLLLFVILMERIILFMLLVQCLSLIVFT